MDTEHQDNLLTEAIDQTKIQMANFNKALIIATGAVAAVIVNSLASTGDHPHLAALFYHWFFALPSLIIAIFYASLIYFQQYKAPDKIENDKRPRWLVRIADYVISKMSKKPKLF